MTCLSNTELEDWLGFYKRAHVNQSFAPTCILCHAESPEARQRLGQLFETASTRFGLRCRPSVLRDVMFHQVPCVARLHIPATSDELTVVAEEHAVCRRVKFEGPFRPTSSTFTSCRYGSMS